MRSILVIASIALSGVSLLAESAAGIRWTAPAEWKAQGPRPMRAATYSVPVIDSDQGVAECVVNYFGPGEGGSVEANVERWKSQVLGTDGKPAPAKIDKGSTRGIAVTRIDASGTYTGMGGPMAAAKPVAGYRLLGAIVEAPGGNVFFKLTGPAKTIARQQKNFDQLLASIQLDK
jgi:hypothetical protein